MAKQAKPKEPTKTMTGAELGARVLALEAFTMVIIESVLDQPGVSPKDAQETLTRMAKAAKELANDTKHPEVMVQADMYVDDIVERLMTAMPKMRDGKPG